MDVYQLAVSRAVKNWMKDARRSADFVALNLGITRGTFYAKLSNHRTWTLENVRALTELGVQVPNITQPRKAGHR